MPEILTYNTPGSIEKERIKQPFYKGFYDWFSSKDKFTKLYLITFALIIIVTPFIVNNYLETRQKAEGGAVRGVSGDLWADVIIGRRDFTDVLARGYVNPRWLDRPGGAVVDRDTAGSTLGYLFAQSTRENRIIALNLDNCIPQGTTCAGEKVIGQPNINDYSACNGDSSFQNYPNRAPASERTLCFVKEDSLSTAENLAFVGMYAQGGNLYVPDTENHRIMIYNDAWNDQTADEVIGQDDFTGIFCNKQNVGILSTTPSASSLCLVDYTNTSRAGSGVALDLGGNLWVADNGNQRVLRFPKDTASGKISKTADIVLGQPDFITGPGKRGTGLNQLSNPNSLRFDPSGNLYVSDIGNSRILKFTPAEQRIGGSATVFANVAGFITEVDTINSGLWIINYSPTGHRLQLYDFNGVLIKDLTSTQFLAGGIGVTKNGALIVNSPTQGVYYASNPLTRDRLGDAGDRVLFDFKSTISNLRISGAGHGVAIAANKLFASDSCRILVWNDPAALTNGKAADAVLIQPNFGSFDCNVNNVAVLKGDSDNQLWAKTRKGIYVYDANNIASSGTAPIKIISDPIPVLGGGTLNVLTDYEGNKGITPQKIDGKLFLWVANADDNRVVRIRDPLTSPVIDMVLGQTDLTGTSCNRGLVLEANQYPASPPDLTMLCRPGALSIDKHNNLYVSDHSLEVRGNWRLLMFSASTFPTNNTSIIYNSAATKEFPKATGSGQNHPTWEPAFDSQNHMVVGYNGYIGGRFVGYYLDPTDPAKNQPDGYLKDLYSGPFGATFDSQDNLYVSDISRPRVMIYKNPFNTSVASSPSPVPSPSPTPSPITSPSPMPTLTSSIAITPTPTPVPVTLPVSDTGKITGTVSSSAGGVVSGAKITVSTKKSIAYATNSLGVYAISNLNPGTHSLKFSAQGYINRTISVTVVSNTTTTTNVTLVRR